MIHRIQEGGGRRVISVGISVTDLNKVSTVLRAIDSVLSSHGVGDRVDVDSVVDVSRGEFVAVLQSPAFTYPIADEVRVAAMAHGAAEAVVEINWI